MCSAHAALFWLLLFAPPPATLRVQAAPFAEGARGREVVVRRLNGDCMSAGRLDAHGAFESRLPPGLYLVEFGGAPASAARVVSLGPGQTASVVVGCAAAAKARPGPPSFGSVALPILEGARAAGVVPELPGWARQPAGPSR